MRLTDLNESGGIGANCLLLEFDGLSIVVDAGIHPRAIGKAALPRLDLIRDRRIDLIFITHAHLDHLGALPVLVRDHPETPVIMSRDTEQYYKRMLQNSCNVMERQRVEQGVSDYPLFSFREISSCARQVIGIGTDQPRQFESPDGSDRITFSLHSSGHIPGAVGILLAHHHRRIFLTGDVLFSRTHLLDGAQFPAGDVDTLFLETTRGATQRQVPRHDELENLLRSIETTTRHGGSMLVPVFALGRMQELVAALHLARAEGRLHGLPIYVSGLGIDLLNQFDRISRKSNRLRISRKIFRELGATKLPKSHHPGDGKPALYLVSSGMMVENTPSYTVAAALLGSEKNTIAFVGYCDPDTPGGKLQAAADGESFFFKALGRKVPIRAQRRKFDLSSHADREELLTFASSVNPRTVVLKHGDAEAREWFREALSRESPAAQIMDPVPLQQTLL